jgi:hypothetical protein
MSISTAVVDAHVHIHACYELEELLDNAHRNLSRAPQSGAVRNAPGGQALFLLMTECAPDDYFGALYEASRTAPSAGPGLRRWSMLPTGEEVSLRAASGARHLFIVAGRQVACREGLEVLVLGTRRRFRDGLPIREVLAETGALGVPRVIPWGAGKWLFRRGRLLNELVREFRSPTLFLGDEGGRPVFWGYPAHFGEAARLGVRDLPGTDPLPFPHDVNKVGRMGFRLELDFDPVRPAASLMSALTSQGAPLERFAVLESPLRFVRNQIGMQLRKRHRA